MSKKKSISVREFLGRLWKQKKFTWALVWNDGDVLWIRMDKGRDFIADDYYGEILAENETIDIETEFSIKDWDMGVRHWIPASALPCYKHDGPFFRSADELLEQSKEFEP